MRELEMLESAAGADLTSVAVAGLVGVGGVEAGLEVAEKVAVVQAGRKRGAGGSEPPA